MPFIPNQKEDTSLLMSMLWKLLLENMQ
jgi:hypothetical protein